MKSVRQYTLKMPNDYHTVDSVLTTQNVMSESHLDKSYDSSIANKTNGSRE